MAGDLTVSFTRGFVSSQAFARHFGPDATFAPTHLEPHSGPVFDTSSTAEHPAPDGTPYTWWQEFAWLGRPPE